MGYSKRKSKDFLVVVISECSELWPVANLEVIPWSQLPLNKIFPFGVSLTLPKKDWGTQKDIFLCRTKNLAGRKLLKNRGS